jgi:hypothetical protein
MTDEQRELMRIAAQSTLDRSRGGRDLEADVRRWATHWAKQKPIGRPLSTGEPADPRLPHLEAF